MVQRMLQNSSVLSNFKSVCYAIEPKIDDVVSLNLLEHKLILFTKAFKDIREKHKAAKQISRKRALRTEVKVTPMKWDIKCLLSPSCQ